MVLCGLEKQYICGMKQVPTVWSYQITDGNLNKHDDNRDTRL
jgi:hypothetical protein